MAQTKIEWAEASWNPVTGCTKISTGCVNYYAERVAKRLKIMGNYNYRNGFEVTLQTHMLEMPLRWKTPKKIFVNSMSDIFHDAVPSSYIEQIFSIMTKASWHTFQILTKRSERLLELSPYLHWPKNVWMGVTVEHPDFCYRIRHLLQSAAITKFLSCEPLLAPLGGTDLSGIGGVIVGGESGPKVRPMASAWATAIRDACQLQKVPFFFKQWGGIHKKKKGRILDGKIWNEWPFIYYE